MKVTPVSLLSTLSVILLNYPLRCTGSGYWSGYNEEEMDGHMQQYQQRLSINTTHSESSHSSTRHYPQTARASSRTYGMSRHRRVQEETPATDDSQIFHGNSSRHSRHSPDPEPHRRTDFRIRTSRPHNTQYSDTDYDSFHEVQTARLPRDVPHRYHQRQHSGPDTSDDPLAVMHEFRRLGITEFNRQGEVVTSPSGAGRVHNPRSPLAAGVYRDLGDGSSRQVADRERKMIEYSMSTWDKIVEELRRRGLPYMKKLIYILNSAYLHGIYSDVMVEFFIRAAQNNVQDVRMLPDTTEVCPGITLHVLKTTKQTFDA